MLHVEIIIVKSKVTQNIDHSWSISRSSKNVYWEKKRINLNNNLLLSDLLSKGYLLYLCCFTIFYLCLILGKVKRV